MKEQLTLTKVLTTTLLPLHQTKGQRKVVLPIKKRILVMLGTSVKIGSTFSCQCLFCLLLAYLFLEPSLVSSTYLTVSSLTGKNLISSLMIQSLLLKTCKKRNKKVQLLWNKLLKSMKKITRVMLIRK